MATVEEAPIVVNNSAIVPQMFQDMIYASVEKALAAILTDKQGFHQGGRELKGHRFHNHPFHPHHPRHHPGHHPRHHRPHYRHQHWIPENDYRMKFRGGRIERGRRFPFLARSNEHQLETEEEGELLQITLKQTYKCPAEGDLQKGFENMNVGDNDSSSVLPKNEVFKILNYCIQGTYVSRYIGKMFGKLP
ncbi:hypothetical protein JTB14_028368 [Gonioctena quinquepunctata]|nr:hypothetical protein JTB14_028368 [Gonioctena quinquepunctata]